MLRAYARLQPPAPLRPLHAELVAAVAREQTGLVQEAVSERSHVRLRQAAAEVRRARRTVTLTLRRIDAVIGACRATRPAATAGLSSAEPARVRLRSVTIDGGMKRGTLRQAAFTVRCRRLRSAASTIASTPATSAKTSGSERLKTLAPDPSSLVLAGDEAASRGGSPSRRRRG